MAPTPEVLLKHGVRATQTAFPVPRVVHAFKGTTKTHAREFLTVVYAAMAAKAIAGEGRHRKAQRLVTQDELAGMAGYAVRQSYTRCASRFAEKVESTKRKRASNPLPVILRDRNFAAPNRMALILPGRQEDWLVMESKTGRPMKRKFSQRRAEIECDTLRRETGRLHHVEAVALDQSRYHSPTLDELLADPRTKNWWDASCDVEGFKYVSRWIWDKHIPDPDRPGKRLGPTARLVMTAYEHFGMHEQFRNDRGEVTKEKGVLHIHQQKVADYLHISLRSVYKANRKWEKLGILRIAHERGQDEQTGARWSGPQIVIYLPTRMLTEREAAEESRRLQARASEIVAREGEWRRQQLEQAARLHQELLTAWTGKEHCLRAFHNEIYRILCAAGIDNDLIPKLIPTRPPE